MSHGSDALANQIFENLVGTDNAQLPEVNLSGSEYSVPWTAESEVYQPVTRLQVSEITSGEVGGTGIFDVLMSGFSAHLKNEYDKNRITGAEYTKAFIALCEGAMQNAIQYALGREQVFWQSVQAQAGAITSRVQNELAKVETRLSQANYALTKLRLANEDITYGTAKYQLTAILPKQALLTGTQIDLVKEQTEVQKAQTLDYRRDPDLGVVVPIKGILGKQKDLYDRQIMSYYYDSKIKAAKPFIDFMLTSKTTDLDYQEPPTARSDQIDHVLKSMRSIVTSPFEKQP